MNSTVRFEKTLPIAGVVPTMGEPSGQPIDYEALAAQYQLNAWQATCAEKFARFTAGRENLLVTSWLHEGIRPYRASIQKVLAWQYSFPGLLISGPTGRGKTRSMLALIKRLMCEEFIDASCWYAQDLAIKIANEVSYGRDDAQAFVRAVAGHKLLVIDDLGQEAVVRSQEDRVDSWLFELFDRRLSAHLPCIITTNLPADQLGAGFRHEPFLRRLLELCGGQPIIFK